MPFSYFLRALSGAYSVSPQYRGFAEPGAAAAYAAYSKADCPNHEHSPIFITG
jgi:hypothetical protein